MFINSLKEYLHSPSIPTEETSEETPPKRKLLPLRVLSIIGWVMLIALLAAYIVLWCSTLNVPYDRDSFDEGVYWQSLRAISEGNILYQDIFYSQPPLFLIVVYPFYALLGETLLAARMGIASFALLGLIGGALIGHALAGRRGMIAAMILLFLEPTYLQFSQTLQAEAPAIAFALIACGGAYQWRKHPYGAKGIIFAIITGSTLSLALCSKLLAISFVVPIGWILLESIWRIIKEPEERLRLSIPLIAGLLALIITTVLVFLPFIHSFASLWDMVVTFHVAAEHELAALKSRNRSYIRMALTTFLLLGAAGGLYVAWLRRDKDALHLLLWFGTSVFLLWRQVPLFTHHFIILAPPLVALTVLAFRPLPEKKKVPQWRSPALVITLLMCIILLGDFVQARSYYRTSVSLTQNRTIETQVIQDIQKLTPPDSKVLTDAPFLVAQAGYTTPPMFVDVSQVRVQSGYATLEQVITASKEEDIQTVVIFTDTRLKRIPGFMDWVNTNYTLATQYPEKFIEVWVKIK